MVIGIKNDQESIARQYDRSATVWKLSNEVKKGKTDGTSCDSGTQSLWRNAKKCEECTWRRTNSRRPWTFMPTAACWLTRAPASEPERKALKSQVSLHSFVGFSTAFRIWGTTGPTETCFLLRTKQFTRRLLKCLAQNSAAGVMGPCWWTSWEHSCDICLNRLEEVRYCHSDCGTGSWCTVDCGFDEVIHTVILSQTVQLKSCHTRNGDVNNRW